MTTSALFKHPFIRWRTWHKVVTSCVLASLLAGLLPSAVAERVAATTAQAAAVAAPLAQTVSGSNVLAITKILLGSGSGPFTVTVAGPYGYLNNTTVSPSAPTVLTGLASGVYTVTAYNAAGVAVGTATSNATGNYTLNPSGAGPYQVTFSNIPSGYEPAKRSSGNGTSTQFVTTVAGASNVNWGLIIPSQYCQANPTMCTSLYVNGLAASSSVLNSFAYNSSGTTASTNLAIGSQIGSTWGLAWMRTKKWLFAAALLKT